MIDLNGNRTYSKEELKARAMSRLSESGLGLAERMANIERIVYSLLDPKAHPLTDKAQVQAIGAALAALESDYNAEVADNASLKLVLEHEAAAARLAQPALKNADYPDVRDPDTGRFVRHPALVADDVERAAAQAVVDAASAATLTLVTERAAYRVAQAVA